MCILKNFYVFIKDENFFMNKMFFLFYGSIIIAKSLM